jgi:hypothetical protein
MINQPRGQKILTARFLSPKERRTIFKFQFEAQGASPQFVQGAVGFVIGYAR